MEKQPNTFFTPIIVEQPYFPGAATDMRRARVAELRSRMASSFSNNTETLKPDLGNEHLPTAPLSERTIQLLGGAALGTGNAIDDTVHRLFHDGTPRNETIPARSPREMGAYVLAA